MSIAPVAWPGDQAARYRLYAGFWLAVLRDLDVRLTSALDEAVDLAEQIIAGSLPDSARIAARDAWWTRVEANRFGSSTVDEIMARIAVYLFSGLHLIGEFADAMNFFQVLMNRLGHRGADVSTLIPRYLPSVPMMPGAAEVDWSRARFDWSGVVADDATMVNHFFASVLTACRIKLGADMDKAIAIAMPRDGSEMSVESLATAHDEWTGRARELQAQWRDRESNLVLVGCCFLRPDKHSEGLSRAIFDFIDLMDRLDLTGKAAPLARAWLPFYTPIVEVVPTVRNQQ